MSQKFCPNCGTPLQPENKFCPGCGSKTALNTVPVSDQTQLITPSQQNDDTRIASANDSTRMASTNDATRLASTPHVQQPFIGNRPPQPDQPVDSRLDQPRSQSKSLMWILIAVGAIAIGGGIAFLLVNNKSSHERYYSGSTTDADDFEAAVAEEVPAPEYEAPAEEAPVAEPVTEAVSAPNNSLLSSYDTYARAYNLSGSDLTYTKNFTRPDLTINDLHGRVLVVDIFFDNEFSQSVRFNSNGEITSAVHSFKPAYTIRDSKGRIIHSTYNDAPADYHWNNGLLSSAVLDNGCHFDYSYDSKGQLSSITHWCDGQHQGTFRYYDYTYDDCLNWTSRRYEHTSGTSGVQRRDIYYYPVN